jgi:hypothetical protein
MVIVCVPVHPPASVAVQVYTPAHKPVAVFVAPEVVFATEGDHTNVYGADPPTAETVTLPLQDPLHVTFVCEVLFSVIDPPDVGTVTVAVDVPQVEVTVTV